MTNERVILVHSTSQDRRVEEAHARLHRSRLHTRETLTGIRQELAERADLRRMVRARPELFLALAFFTGFLLAHRR
jgi:hypothetical protein